MSAIHLQNLVSSQAVGFATTKTTFNDLQTYGLWPAYQYIKHVDKIVIYTSTNPNVVNGIVITYSFNNGSEPVTIKNGSTVGTATTVADLSANASTQFFAGFFGQEDQGAQPVLRSLGFLVYNTVDGSISVKGPFPAPVQNPNPKINGFSSLGEIVAFTGTVANNGNLDTLAITKFQPGTGGSGI